MRRMLLWLLCVLLSSQLTVSDRTALSSLNESETRIVGGSEVEPPHKYPFQVSPLLLLFIFLKPEMSDM